MGVCVFGSPAFLRTSPWAFSGPSGRGQAGVRVSGRPGSAVVTAQPGLLTGGRQIATQLLGQ